MANGIGEATVPTHKEGGRHIKRDLSRGCFVTVQCLGKEGRRGNTRDNAGRRLGQSRTHPSVSGSFNARGILSTNEQSVSGRRRRAASLLGPQA